MRAVAALAAATVALYVLASSMAMTVQAYSPLPFWDSWGYFDPGEYTPAFLFAQHNEHRIAVPAIFFFIDLMVDRGTNVLLLVVNYLCIAATAALLLLHLPRRAARSDLLLVGALVVALMFSAMQYTNLVWGFQIQFFLVDLLAVAAIVAASATARPSLSRTGTALAVAFGISATYSLANGMLVWPVIAVVAARLGASRAVVRVFAVAGLLTIGSYFIGYRFSVMTYATWNPGQMLAFGLAYLGGPAGTVVSGALARLTHAVWPPEYVSVAAGLVVVLLTVRLVARAARAGAARADVVLAAIAVFVVLTAAVTAHGRAVMPLVEAISPRYTTPPLVLYAALAVAALREAWASPGLAPQPLGRRFVAAALVGIVVVALHQPDKLTWSTLDHQRYQRALMAVETGAFDPDAYKIVYPTPSYIVPIIAMLRERHLSAFAADARWTGSLGQPVSDIAPLVTSACAGTLDSLAPIAGAASGGEAASGWASAIRGAAPDRIALVGDGDRVEGFAGTGDPRPDVIAARPALRDTSGWTGYVRPGSGSRTITAYAVRGYERCALWSPRRVGAR